jgi:hypothetical protein
MPSKQKPAKAPARVKSPARKSVTETSPAASPRTFDDFRGAYLAAFDLKTDEFRNEELCASIVRWSRDATDASVSGWLEKLAPRPYRVRAAALVAVERALKKDLPSARQFLQIAESLGPPTEDWLEQSALVPAWWRLGQAEKAEAACLVLEKNYPRTRGYSSDSAYQMGNLVGLAGRADLVSRWTPLLVDRNAKDGPVTDAQGEEVLAPGLLALIIDGADDAFHSVMQFLNELKSWHGLRSSNGAASFELLRHFVGTGQPGRYVELALRYPGVLRGDFYIRHALLEAEKVSPAEAVRLARQILRDETSWDLRRLHGNTDGLFQSVAILADRAPQEAEQWAGGARAGAMLEPGSNLRFGLLAALGRVDALRRELPAVVEKDPKGVATFTSDRALARDLLLAMKENEHNDGGSLLMLVALGERAFVDRWLENKFEAQKALKQGERHPGMAARFGRKDIAVATQRLLKVSQRSPEILMVQCAGSGDWTGAMEFIEQKPPAERFGRMHQLFFDSACEMRRFDDDHRHFPLRSVPAA